MRGKTKHSVLSEYSIPFFDIKDVDSTSFIIKPLQFNSKTLVENELPHRHNFQELIWIQEGKGRHCIDNKILEIKPRMFYMITQGQVHFFLDDVSVTGTLIRFTNDFVLSESVGNGIYNQLTLFNLFSIRQSIIIDQNDMPEFEKIMAHMLKEFSEKKIYWVQTIRNLLNILLINLERVRKNDSGDTVDLPVNRKIYNAFLELLEKEFKSQHEVLYYSRVLNLSVRQLSSFVRKFTGKTAKRLILERITIEAKRYLQHTDASIKEISYNLGFEDPSYFTKTFKQITNISPGSFRGEV